MKTLLANAFAVVRSSSSSETDGRISRVVAGGTLNFRLSENFNNVRKFSSKIAKFGAENPHFGKI